MYYVIDKTSANEESQIDGRNKKYKASDIRLLSYKIVI